MQERKKGAKKRKGPKGKPKNPNKKPKTADDDEKLKGAHQPAFVAPDPKTPDVLKPVCNNKRCPGKTCEGEQQGKSWYAVKATGTFAPAWRAYKAFSADPREKVALADLVEMGVRELDGRDPTTQVDVERDDLLKYDGKIGLCNSCTPRSAEAQLNRRRNLEDKTRKRGPKCSDPFGKGCRNPATNHNGPTYPDCKAEKAAGGGGVVAALERGARVADPS